MHSWPSSPTVSLCYPLTVLTKRTKSASPTSAFTSPAPTNPSGCPAASASVRTAPLHGEKNFTVYRHASFDCGYLLEMGGKRIFQPGDTEPLEQHLDLSDIVVLLISPTVHNMYIDRSAILTHHLESAFIFDQHFGTYRETEDNLFWTRGYPDELRSALAPRLRERFTKPIMGRVYGIA